MNNSGTSNKSILVVEDEVDVKNLIVLHLKREGYQVAAVADGNLALEELSKNKYDLVVLDWMLPGISGLEIVKRLRSSSGDKNSSTPILMVTARADTADVVLGLEMGADDYVTKPFELPVLIARTRSLMRRQLGSNIVLPTDIKIGDLRVNEDAFEVYCAGEKVELTASEFKLLSSLIKNRGRVLSRERLINLVQGYGVAVTDRSIDTHIFGLRKKLGSCADLVETIRGIGYRIGT